MSKRLSIEDGTPCTYCGGIATHWDHVVPVSALRPNSKLHRIQPDDWIVPACQECNLQLSDRMLHSVPLRAKWLFQRYRKKYKKLMCNTSWTDDEINQLSGSFKIMVMQTMLAQAELDHRLAYLHRISLMPYEFMRP